MPYLYNWKSIMRLLLVLTLSALLATTGLAGAQESFFNGRFCAMSAGGDTVTPFNDCSFHTWDQCIASARGLGRWCTTNVWWHGPRQQPKTQGKSRQRNR